MYVDKPLTGVAAVQTLSRLNRIHPLKSQDDLHILDFANQAADIQAAFAPWFETTLTEPGDPNLLYAKEREVMDYGLLVASEMESFIRVLGAAGPGRMPDAAERKLHAELHGYLQPAIDRFNAMETEDEQEGFRGALRDYVRAYSLIAQIADWGDRDLERLCQYGRLLLIRLPGRPQVSVDVGDVDLSHFRLEYTGKENVSLAPAGDGVVRGHASDGGGYAAVKHSGQPGIQDTLTDVEAALLEENVQALLGDDRTSEAIDLLDDAIGRVTSNPELSLRLRRLLGAGLFYADEYTRAASVFDAVGREYAKSLPPTSPLVIDSSYYAGHAYAQISKPERALPHLRFYVQNADSAQDEDEAAKVLESRFVIAHMLANAGDTDEALNELEAVRPLLASAYGVESTQVRNLDKQISRLK